MLHFFSATANIMANSHCYVWPLFIFPRIVNFYCCTQIHVWVFLTLSLKYQCEICLFFFSTSQLFLLIIYSHKIIWMKSHYMSLWKYNCAVHTHYLNKIRGAGWIYCRSTLTVGLFFFHPTRFYKMWTYISQKQSANSVITVWFRWHLYITLNSFHFSTL